MKYKIIIVAILILLGNQKIFSQNSFVKGKIIDYETNKPMPAVTVVENFSMNGTISGMDGNFEVNLEGNTRKLEVCFVTCYTIKFINIPIENKHIDFGHIKMVTNYLTVNTGPGIFYTITEYDREKDKKLRNNVLKKYRIKVLGKKLKPYFEGNKLVFDFNKNGKK